MMNLTDTQKNKQISKRPQQVRGILEFIPGIWINGQYYWLQNRTEKVIFNEELIINVKQEQLHSKIRFFQVFISNHSKKTKEIKVLAMHYFSNIVQDHLTFISPQDHRIFHHSNKEVFLVNGQYHGIGLTEYTTMPIWYAYTDHIWNSVQMGSLKYQPMAKGPAVSIFAQKMTIPPQETNKMYTWIITGSSKNELLSMEEGLVKRIGGN